MRRGPYGGLGKVTEGLQVRVVGGCRVVVVVLEGGMGGLGVQLNSQPFTESLDSRRHVVPADALWLTCVTALRLPLL